MTEKIPAIDRFSTKYEIDPVTGCWNWIKSCDGQGYGQFWSGSKLMRSHRWAYNYYKGNLSQNLCVCHKCDNIKCVNPDHMFLGTQDDNLKDMTNKGRRALDTAKNRNTARGERQGRSKLTEEQVREILTFNGNQHDIARKFNVTHSLISSIKLRKVWKHLQV